MLARLAIAGTSMSGVDVLTPRSLHIALYLTKMAYTAVEKDIGVSAVDAACYSIAWCHRLAGLYVCPTNHPLVKFTLEGARRMLARPLHLKEPLPLELIERINDAYSRTECLTVRRFLFILLVGYAGFFRIDEIQGLKVMDVSIYTEHMSVFIPKRKIDQFREGHTSLIARCNKATCPV